MEEFLELITENIKSSCLIKKKTHETEVKTDYSFCLLSELYNYLHDFYAANGPSLVFRNKLWCDSHFQYRDHSSDKVNGAGPTSYSTTGTAQKQTKKEEDTIQYNTNKNALMNSN